MKIKLMRGSGCKRTAIISAQILLLFLFPVFSYGQTKKPLTLDDCINLARKSNESVKIQTQIISQAEQEILQAKGDIRPNLSYTYEQNYEDNNSNSAGSEGTESAFSISQPLFHGFAKLRTIDLAKSNKHIAELQLQDVTRSLDSQVANAFYTLVQSESDYNNTNDTINKLLEREHELNHWVQLGKSRESELYAVESQVAILRSNLQSILGDSAKAMETLSFLIDVDTASIFISETMPEPQYVKPVAKYIERAITRSDIIEAREGENGEELRVKIVKGTYFPSLDLNGSWYNTRTGSLAGADWSTFLTLNMPLYQGGIIKAKVKEELSRLEESRYVSSLALRQVITEVRQLHASLESSIAQVSALKDAYGKSQKSYNLQVQDYRFGLVTNLDVLQAALTLLDVKSSLDRTVLQSKLNKVLLDISIR